MSMIRPATTADIERINALEYELFPDNSLSCVMLERELAVSQVFVEGDPLHAYAIVGHDGELLDLLRLGVDTTQQGRGAGTRLLLHTLSLAQPMMLTVRKNNARALRLYRKHGFEVIGHFSEKASWVMRWEPAAADGPSR
jgi:ribosomal protein S18 acetylase RimI-like enzyme